MLSLVRDPAELTSSTVRLYATNVLRQLICRREGAIDPRDDWRPSYKICLGTSNARASCESRNCPAAAKLGYQSIFGRGRIEDSHELCVTAGSCSPMARRVLSTRRQMNVIDGSDAHLPIMTSEAFITAEALSPTFSPSSSTASFVIDDVNVMP